MALSREVKDEYYNSIIPTAWLTAYRRTFTDIPFSREIFERLDKLQKTRGYPITEEMKAAQLSPQMEARYKLVNHLLKEQRAEQILEIAAGFTSRGMELSRNTATYVEFDLPQVIEEKQRIINKIDHKGFSNLHLVAGNVLNLNSLIKATTYFDKKKPLIIINEGLLRYLNFEEKAIVARNIHYILEQFNGTWITPDITLKSVMYNENKNVKTHNTLIQRMTKINTDQNRFDTEKEAEQFFKKQGFSIERHNYLEVRDQLISPKILSIPDDVVEEMISFPIAYVLKIEK
ncbi:MAG: class I SAM-dependent methyltransferase [Candidatus Woesearchaeota archaeon]